MSRTIALRFSTPAFGAMLAGWALVVAYLLSGGDAATATLASLLAVLPVALLAFFALASSSRVVLAGAAFGLSLTANVFNSGVPLIGSVVVFLADIVVVLAIGSWIVTVAVRRRDVEARARFRSAVLSWPLVIFGVIVVVDGVRGHYAYGAGIVGEPVRLVLYAGVAAALTEMRPERLYRLIVGVFYGGAGWQFILALYHLATGTSQTSSFALSTGGERVVAIAVSFYLAAALFLALLNFEYRLIGNRFVHLAVALLSAVGIVLSYARGTLVAVAVVVAVLFVAFRGVRRACLWMLPVALPAIAAAFAFAPHYADKVAPTLTTRLTASLQRDPSVRWRLKANEMILRQFRASPIYGVGFGKGAAFSSDWEWVTIPQDPHNDYLYLLAGGGIIALASFALLLIAYLWDVWRRRRVRDPHERVLLIWGSAMLFTFLLNAVAEPLMTSPSILLTMWALLVLPATIPLPRESS